MAKAMNSLMKVSSTTPSFSAWAKSEKAQRNLMQYFPSDKDRARFTSAIISAVSSNPAIGECTHQSIMAAGLKCINYDFLPGGDLGDAYLVPFGNQCTVVLGYKGLIRLAQRSGKVRTLNMGIVRRGQTVTRDTLSGDIEIIGEAEKPDAEAIGYFAFIRLAGSGFEKAEYMTKQDAVAHAERYAKTSFDPKLFEKYESFMRTGEGLSKEEQKATGGVYYTNFDQMAMKNIMRRLLLRWAPLSISDQQMLKQDENPAEAFDMPGFENDTDVDVTDKEPVPEPSSEGKKAEIAEEDDFFQGE